MAAKTAKREPATEKDLAFLKSRSYELSTVEETQAFIDKFSPKEYAGYLQDLNGDADEPAMDAAPEEPTKTIILYHPITHDGAEYTRGEHTLPVSLADLFLTYKDPVSGRPTAVEPKPVEVVKGKVNPLSAK